jgi:hypothetical protein
MSDMTQEAVVPEGLADQRDAVGEDVEQHEGKRI